MLILVVLILLLLLPATTGADIELIAKIAPKNEGFTGMVDADQVLGGGGSGTLPNAAVSATNVTQHHSVHEVLGEGQAGQVWNLASTPVAGTERVFLNTLSLKRKTSGPGVNEYTISGNQITLWASKETGDYLEVDYML